jgi:hypothetical protein
VFASYIQTFVFYLLYSWEEWAMCVPTAEQHVEPPNGVDTEMTVSKYKNRKAA